MQILRSLEYWADKSVLTYVAHDTVPSA